MPGAFNGSDDKYAAQAAEANLASGNDRVRDCAEDADLEVSCHPQVLRDDAEDLGMPQGCRTESAVVAGILLQGMWILDWLCNSLCVSHLMTLQT